MDKNIKPTIVVSRCLGFEKCRYNGDVIINKFIERLKKYVNYITVCPEMDIGMEAPREPIRLVSENEKIEFTLRVSPNEGVITEPAVLHEDTLAKILELYSEGGMSQEQVFRIEMEKGRCRMLSPLNPLDYIKTLSEELDSLRVNLHEVRVAAGLSEMAGPGVIVKLYDAPNGYATSDIIHDSNVRDVVNELFSAGAKGVVVGGQRLIATSPIRCVGPVIRVNQKEIPANPVVIEAVGDPEVLASGLDLIRFSLEFHRDFRFEIEKKDNIVLPPYRN